MDLFLSVPRKIPKLTADTYPSIFPNLPSYLSEEPAVKRKSPDRRRAEMDARDEQCFKQWLSKDKIQSFDDMSSKMDVYLQKDYSDWTALRSVEHICIYRMEIVDVPGIIASVRVDKSLHVDIFEGELQIDSAALKEALGSDSILTCWSQLSSILSQLSSLSDRGDLSISTLVSSVEKLMGRLCDKLSDNDDYRADFTCHLRFFD